MKVFFTSFLLGLFTLSLCAQKPYLVDMSAHYLYLKSCPYSVEKVIDATNQEEVLGYFQAGMGMPQQTLAFKKGMQAEVQAFLQRNLPATAGKQPLTIRLNAVKASQLNLRDKQIAIATLSLTFFRKNGETYEELYTAFATSSRQSLAAAQAQDLNLSHAFSDCFQQLMRLSPSPKPKSVEETAMYKPFLENADIPAKRLIGGKHGIYHTYSDFLFQTPDTITPFKVTYFTVDTLKKQTAQFSFLDKSRKEKVWGFWDEKQVYVGDARQVFHPLFYENERYYLWLPPAPTAEQLAKVSARDVMLGVGTVFGLVGGLVAGLALDATDKTADKKLVKYELNYLSSEFELVEGQKGAGTSLFLVSSMYNDKESVIEVWWEEQQIARLTAASYTLYDFGTHRKPLMLTFKCGDKATTALVQPHTYEKAYLMCKRNADGSLSTAWLQGDEKAEIKQRIDKGRYVQAE